MPPAIKRSLLLVSLLGCLGIIAFFSQEDGKRSRARSGMVTQKVLNCLDKHFPPPPEPVARAWRRHTVEHNLRALAHGAEFAAAAALVCALLLSLNFPPSRARAWALGIALLFAVIDETHQLFIPRRSFQIKDIAMDCFGAYWGIVVVIAFYNILHKNELSEQSSSPAE